MIYVLLAFIGGLWLGKKYQFALKWEKGLLFQYKNSAKQIISTRLFTIG